MCFQKDHFLLIEYLESKSITEKEICLLCALLTSKRDIKWINSSTSFEGWRINDKNMEIETQGSSKSDRNEFWFAAFVSNTPQTALYRK